MSVFVEFIDKIIKKQEKIKEEVAETIKEIEDSQETTDTIQRSVDELDKSIRENNVSEPMLKLMNNVKTDEEKTIKRLKNHKKKLEFAVTRANVKTNELNTRLQENIFSFAKHMASSQKHSPNSSSSNKKIKKSSKGGKRKTRKNKK